MRMCLYDVLADAYYGATEVGWPCHTLTTTAAELYEACWFTLYRRLRVPPEPRYVLDFAMALVCGEA